MAGGSGREQFLPWRHGPLSPNGGHPVIWQLGEEVERYPDVHEWLGSVNAYLLEDIERMEAGESPSPTGGLVTTLWQRRRRGAVGLSDSSAEASATGSPSFLIGWFVAGAGDVDVAQRGAGPVEVDTGRVQSPHGRAARVVKGGEQQVMRADREWTRQSGRCGQDRLDRWGGARSASDASTVSCAPGISSMTAVRTAARSPACAARIWAPAPSRSAIRPSRICSVPM